MLEKTIGVVILAGGKGLRFGSHTPKQFVKMQEKEIALYSFETFAAHPEVREIAIVTPQKYQSLFSPCTRFAKPGLRRQDSVENGFLALEKETEWICVHDAARPFISQKMLSRLFAAKKECKAATVAIPVTSTIKECYRGGWVHKTLCRDHLWEIQTPQLIHRSILEQGLEVAKKRNLTVTDDVSFAELIDCRVKLVEGCPHNLKITRKEDLILAAGILS